MGELKEMMSRDLALPNLAMTGVPEVKEFLGHLLVKKAGPETLKIANR